ncbi:MAG: hypothetical protein HY062_10785 [Bacteroidetes bacterium]|nr:hypothetical protein [Bacteroidota bacterium]
MKTKNILLLSITLFSVLVSCKKDTTTPQNTPDTTSTSVSQGIDAEIYVFKEIYLDNVASPYTMHAATFYGSSLTSSTVASVYAGTVTLNGVVLKMDNSNTPGPIYTDTTYAISGNTYQMNVSGSGQFPAANIQYGQNFPTFNDTALIPSSVQLSAGISKLFNNCVTTDSVDVTLDDNNGHTFSKKYAVSNNQLNLVVTPAELNGFIQTTNGSISIDMVKMDLTPVGAKNYFIILEKRYNKLNIQFN